MCRGGPLLPSLKEKGPTLGLGDLMKRHIPTAQSRACVENRKVPCCPLLSPPCILSVRVFHGLSQPFHCAAHLDSFHSLHQPSASPFFIHSIFKGEEPSHLAPSAFVPQCRLSWPFLLWKTHKDTAGKKSRSLTGGG